MGLKSSLRRIKDASLRRMNQNIQEIHRQTGKNRVFLFCDMVWCALHYGVGYLDYHVFGFARNRGKNRKTFMTMSHNIGLTRLVNDRSLYPIMNDKIRFLETYGAFIGRAYLDLRTCGAAELREFCEAHKVVFAKPISDFGGTGVERLVSGEVSDWDGLYARLTGGKQYLVEEAITQHPDMARLCPDSVNTLRMVTVVLEGTPRFLYALLRMGSGRSHVDNISSGGMYTLVGPEGELAFPAFCDKTGLYYDRHPATETVFQGFRVPCFRQAQELCLQAATTEPRLGYIGWDVAVTPEGPILVEGNVLPGYDMAQNARFHPDGQGLLPTFEKILGRPVPKA